MTQTQQNPTVLSLIASAPVYLFNYLFGLALATISDVTLTSLALGSLFLGYATTPWAGLAIFFLSHTVIKIVNALNGAIVQQGRMVANAGAQLTQIFAKEVEVASRPDLDPVQGPPTEA